jgi:hypothetical protein
MVQSGQNGVMVQSRQAGVCTVEMLIAQGGVVRKDESLLPDAELVGAEGESFLGRELLQDSTSALLEKMPLILIRA